MALARLCLHMSVCTCQGEGSVKNGALQHFYPWGKPQLIPAPPLKGFKISNWISFIHNPVTLKTDAFVLVPRRSESACEPSAGGPESPITLRFTGPKRCQFPKPDVLGSLISLVQVPRIGVPKVRHKPLSPQEETPVFEASPYGVLSHWGWAFSEITSLPFLPISMWPFYCLLWRKRLFG